MTDIRLDSDGDLWYEDGLIDTVTDDDEDLQRLQIAFETGLGEWAFDTEAGMPWKAAAATREVAEVLLDGAIRAISDRILGSDSVRGIAFTQVDDHMYVSVETIRGTVTLTP